MKIIHHMEKQNSHWNIGVVLALLVGLAIPVEATVKNTAVLKGGNLETGTNNLAGADPVSITWDIKSLIDPLVYEHSITGNAAAVVVQEDGDYFLAATQPIIQPGTTGERATSALEVYLNGEPVPGALGRSSMIRNTGGHVQASNHIATLLVGLSTGDSIELKTYRVNQNNVETHMETATLILQKLDENAVAFHATGTELESGPNLNVAEGTGDAMKWTAVRQDDGFGLNSAGTEIQLDESGNYLVFLNLPLHLNGAGARETVAASIQYDGGRVTGGLAQQAYIRNAGAHRDSSNHWSGMVQADFSNSDIRIETYNIAGDGNAGALSEVVVPDGKSASLTILKAPDQDGVFFSSAFALLNEFNWAPTEKDPILFDDVRVIDESVYTHSIDSDAAHQITVPDGGNYLLVYNDTLTGGSARTNPVITVEVNGVEVPGAKTSTHYIRQASRHTSSSGSLVTVLDNLSPGDIITLSTVRDGAGGAPIPDEPALLYLQKLDSFELPDGVIVEPRLTSVAGDYYGFDLVVQAFGSPLDEDSITATLDGNNVELDVQSQGADTLISFRYDDFPPSGSSHAIVLSMADTATPPNNFSREVGFTVTTPYVFISEDAVADGVDTSKPGFIARVSQISTGQSGVGNLHGNTIDGANAQLLGEYLDANGDPYINEASSDTASQWQIDPREIPGVINFEQDGGFAGNFNAENGFIDEFIPGIPGWNNTTDGVAVEFLTYLELKKGFHTFGVNSDDGFEVKSGASVSSLFATRLGFFNGGRGASDSLFNFVAPTDGIYPFRLLYFEGTGGASVEFFSIHNGEKILINDRDNPNAIKAYREGPSIPFVQALSPSGKLLTDTVSVTLVDGEDQQIADGSIELLIDGNPVAAEITATSNGFDISFKNEGFFAGGSHTIELRYDISSDPVKSVVARGAFEVPGGQHAVLLDGPVAYWRLGESGGGSAFSEVGAGLTGTWFGSPGYATERLAVGDGSPSVLLDAGAGTWLDIADHPDINDSPSNPGWKQKSIEFWFKARNLPTAEEAVEGTGIPERQVIYEQGGATRGMNVYLSGTEESDPVTAELWFNVLNRAEQAWGGTLPVEPVNEDGNPVISPNGDAVAISTTIEAGKVYHVVLVMDGDDSAPDSFDGTITGYINGELFGQIGGVHLLYDHTDDIGIGARNEEVAFHDHIVNGAGTFSPIINTTEFFYYDGWLDEFALYNSALSPEQAAAHYLAGTTEVPPDGGGSNSQPFINIQSDGTNLTIQFSDGSLESAPSVNGPWTPLQGASPLNILIAEDQQFFRVIP